MTDDLYFNFYELFHSDIAEKRGINNTTNDPRILTNLMNLTWYVLNPLRIKLGKSIKIEAGWRCPKLVELLKSSTTGHPDGECADLIVNGMSKQQLFEFIRKSGIEYDQLIWEKDSNCLHVGYRKGHNRHETKIRTIINNEFYYQKV